MGRCKSRLFCVLCETSRSVTASINFKGFTKSIRRKIYTITVLGYLTKYFPFRLLKA